VKNWQRRWVSGGHGLLATIVLILSSSHLAAQTQPAPPQTSNAVPNFSELLAFVERYGRPTDLGRLCVALQLGVSERDCKFHQVTIDQGDNTTKHAVGLPLSPSPSAPYVLMLHLGPLIGNIFIVSRDGALKESYYRARGVDYTRLSDEDGRRAFAVEIDFWKDNLAQLKNLGESGGRPRP
jgi:hypothetical protein